MENYGNAEGLSISTGQTIATVLTQHISTLLGATCCVRLKMVKFEPTTPNISQHGATWWPNARKMLRPTMLRYVALTCWNRLAGAEFFQICVEHVTKGNPTLFVFTSAKKQNSLFHLEMYMLNWLRLKKVTEINSIHSRDLDDIFFRKLSQSTFTFFLLWVSLIFSFFF